MDSRAPVEKVVPRVSEAELRAVLKRMKNETGVMGFYERWEWSI